MASGLSLSMRMLTSGIRKAFPSIQNISCEQLDKWRAENKGNLICLVGAINKSWSGSGPRD